MKARFLSFNGIEKFILLSFFAFFCQIISAQGTIGPWDLTRLYETPDWNTTNVDQVDGFTSILYESIDYLGNPVDVYAYYGVPDGTPPAGGWPAAIFAHGGGGTAFTNWVNYWNDKGYAAISMDLVGDYPNDDPTPNPGPNMVGVWGDYQKPIDEQWYYHAVSQIILSHSLIASFPEVNANKIGLLGVSWGGNLTSTVMGVDSRLAWAIPIYGVGFHEGSDGHHGRQLADPEKAEFVSTYYDGKAYFDNVTFPTLWLNGTNDFFFPLTSTQQSSQAVNGPAFLRYTEGLTHGHSPPLSVDEIYHFANSVINGGDTLTTLDKPEINSSFASVEIISSIGINTAELLYTTDGEDVIWPDKIWNTMEANVSGNTISASVPLNSYAIFFTATDNKDLMVSSEYILIDEEQKIVNSNLALSGIAKQSTTAYGGEAYLAIDGNTNGVYTNGSVTHTSNDDTPYWQVTLDSEYSIKNINIFGRTDCCLDRLSNFTVLVFNEEGVNTFAKNVSSYPNPMITINTDGVKGNLILIRSNIGEPLSLAEVEVYSTGRLVHMKKRNADDFAIDGNWDAENRQNVYLWTSDETNINQLWYEIDRGDGYYSYQKYGTDYCLDGNKEGANGQSVYLWERDDDNWNQHWKKVSTGSGTYRLEKRNAPNFALDGGDNAEDGQDLYLWTIGNTNENQQWIFTYVEEPQQKFLESTNTNVLLNFYPNPVQSLAVIQNAENSTLHVYDVAGKLLLTQNIVTNTEQVDLSELGKGIYYAKITSLTSIDVLKIVKQ